MKNISSQSKILRNNLSKKSNGGFTLVELVVVVGIFTAITSVVLANYREFITNANFSSASENVVIALRQAQVYGVATKKSSVPCGTSTFDCAYGVHFDTTNRNLFTIFADADGNKIYDAPGEKVETINLPSGTSLQSIGCPPINCSSRLDITFRRPNPDAFIADMTSQAFSYSGATIVLTNGIKTSTTTISVAGQISLQ